ncbi:MAG: Hsp20 family protein [Gammaproteobacteria bacterium]|nr:Hsp20 family protein [Gammaproteobacteria bacterium]
MNALAMYPSRSRERFVDFDQMLGSWFSPQARRVQVDQPNSPKIDIVETDKGFELMADLPGVKEEEISVNVKEGVLIIEANPEDKPVEEGEQKSVIARERKTGKYYRALKLGAIIDESSIRAEYVNGVLTLTLPKSAKAEPQKIAINAQ